MTPLQATVERDGFAIVQQFLTVTEQESLRGVLGDADGAGTRGLLENPAIAKLARSSAFLGVVSPHLAGVPLPVRAIYFDKTPDNNWLVAWHQDLTIAVRTRVEVDGFGPWSEKNGVPHVQPPAELLAQMITLRIHLDDADRRNGALRVLPGSHQFGRLSSQEIQDSRATLEETSCEVSSGDALLMRPLLLHASSRSTSPRRRRVLHIEYAGFSIPAPLEWHQAA